MTAPDIKPCPFCGGGDVTTCFDHEQGGKLGYAGCDACAARGPDVRTAYDQAHDAPWHAEAIAAWNTRATPLAEALAVPTMTTAAQAMLDLHDGFLSGADVDTKAADRLHLAAAFGAQAFAVCPMPEARPGAMLRALLVALIDPLHPDLDYLRASNAIRAIGEGRADG